MTVMIRNLDDIQLVPTTVRYTRGGSNEVQTREEMQARLFPELEEKLVTVVHDVYGDPSCNVVRFRSAVVHPRAGGGESPWEIRLSLCKPRERNGYYYARDFPADPFILLRGEHTLQLAALGFPLIEALSSMRVHCETYGAVWAMVADHCEQVAGADAVLIDTTKAAIAHHRDWLEQHNSREAWANRLLYHDSETGCPYARNYSHDLSTYATAQEVANMLTAMQDRYRVLGQELRAANLDARPMLQQKGESGRDHYLRVRELPEAEQDKLHKVYDLKEERSQINGLLHRIRDNRIPDEARHYIKDDLKAITAPIVERYDAAREAAYAQWKEETTGDAAWAEELRKREERKRAVRAATREPLRAAR